MLPKIPSRFDTGDSVFIASSQLIGRKKIQEDCICQYLNECVVLADGVGSLPHGATASAFVSETARWAYTHVRQRPYYWEDKKLLLKRIFRTSNLALWQKQREPGFKDGLASTLCIAIIGSKKIWIGNVGDSRVYFIRDGLIDELVPVESQKDELVPMGLGYQRFGIAPRYSSEIFLPGDMVVLATDGVADYITENDLRSAYEISGFTQHTLETCVSHILEAVVEYGSRDNMSVCAIKKI